MLNNVFTHHQTFRSWPFIAKRFRGKQYPLGDVIVCCARESSGAANGRGLPFYFRWRGWFALQRGALRSLALRATSRTAMLNNVFTHHQTFRSWPFIAKRFRGKQYPLGDVIVCCARESSGAANGRGLPFYFRWRGCASFTCPAGNWVNRG